LPKRLVMVRSARAWASVGSSYRAGWNPTNPPNSLPVSTPASNRLRKRIAFRVKSLFSSPRVHYSGTPAAPVIGNPYPLLLPTVLVRHAALCRNTRLLLLTPLA
jgi:hypothetical protein